MPKVLFHHNDQLTILFYLLAVRFPDFWSCVAEWELRDNLDRLAAEPGSTCESIINYWKILKSKSQDELRALFVQTREEARLRLELERDVSLYLPDFDFPEALPENAKWAFHAYWRAEEGVALSLGKSPHRVTSTIVKPYVETHALAAEFLYRLELVQREQLAGALPELIAPVDFVEWARGRMSLPPELEEAVKAASLPMRSLVARIETLEAEKAKLQREREKERGLHPIMRNSYFKILLGMAVANYGHRTDALRTSTAGRIMKDLEKVGISISEDTLRNHLVQAAEEVELKIEDNRG
jgi:hypothetical protein